MNDFQTFITVDDRHSFFRSVKRTTTSVNQSIREGRVKCLLETSKFLSDTKVSFLSHFWHFQKWD